MEHRPRKSRRRVRHLLFTAYLAIVLVLLFAPVNAPDLRLDLPVDTDKVAHFALMAGIGFLEFWRLETSVAKRITAGVAWASAVATATEIAQAWLPYRSGDWLDLLAGVVGGGAGAGTAALIRGLLRA